jgi:GNAT superfamily N-acetyltransferase
MRGGYTFIPKGQSMLTNDIRVIEEIPSPQEFNHLREIVGWGALDEELVQKGLSHSLFCLCIRNSDGLIGFVRLIGDGAMKVYVEELIIDPKYQKRGLGKMLMNRIMKYIKDNFRKGCSIGLFANTGLAEYYSQFGFSKRPDDRPGMQIRL